MTEIKENQAIIVVRNQPIETSYPGGMSGFVEKYTPIGSAMASLAGSLYQEGGAR